MRPGDRVGDREAKAEAAILPARHVAAHEGLEHGAEGINGDIHGSPEYRGHLIGVMAKRAVATALGK